MYSIDSLNYKEGINNYFDIKGANNQNFIKKKFVISKTIHSEITEFLRKIKS